MSEVVFKVVAFGLEGVVVLVFDLPASAPRGGHDLDIVFVEAPIGDPSVAVEDIAFLVADCQLAPVDLQSVVTIGKGNSIYPTISVGVPLRSSLDTDRVSAKNGTRLEQVHPVVEGLVRIGLADEKEMQVVQKCAPTQWLMGVEIVAEQCYGASGAITSSVLIQPPLGGSNLAVLLIMTVLRDDKFGTQCDDLGLARANKHRSYGTVIVGNCTVFVFLCGAVTTVDFLGTMIPSGI